MNTRVPEIEINQILVLRKNYIFCKYQHFQISTSNKFFFSITQVYWN